MKPDEMFVKLKAGETDGKIINDFLSALNNGYRLSAIGELIESDNSDASSAGVFLLEEMAAKASSLEDVALKLSNSADAWRRKVFIEYFLKTKIANAEVIAQICDRLSDNDVYVRSWAILWVYRTNIENFVEIGKKLFGELFDEEVDALELPLKKNNSDRANRAFKFAYLLRQSYSIEAISYKISMEDSFTFDFFQKNKNRGKS